MGLFNNNFGIFLGKSRTSDRVAIAPTMVDTCNAINELFDDAERNTDKLFTDLNFSPEQVRIKDEIIFEKLSLLIDNNNSNRNSFNP